MTDISGIFVISSSTNSQWISLCGHLETVIGNYFLSQAGNPEAYWYAIYYDSSVDRLNECVEITDKNLIGYVYCDDRVAFVLNSVSAKYCYAAHESRLHQNDRCKRFTLCLVLTVRFRSLAPWGKLFQLFI